MQIVHIILITLFLLPIALCADQLRFVISLCRHGAREKLSSNPNNPFITTNNTSWNKRDGDLTEVGKRMQYLIGRQMRERYFKEMGDNPLILGLYNPYQIYAISSNYDRTISSAYAQLMGIFYPGLGPSLNTLQQKRAVPPFYNPTANFTHIQEELGSDALPHQTQAVPVHVLGGTPDYIFRAYDQCPYVKKAYKKSTEEEEVINLEEKYSKSLYPTLRNVTGIEEWDFTRAFYLFDSLECDKYEDIPSNISLPGKIKTLLNQAAANRFMYGMVYNKKVAQVMSTKLFEKWTQFLDDILKEDQTSKQLFQQLRFALFMGHDINFYPLFRLLNKSMSEPTPFASLFRIELYMLSKSALKRGSDLSTKDYYVKLLYNDEILKLNGVNKIALDDYISFMSENMIDEEEFISLCHVPPSHSHAKSSSNRYTALWVTLLILFLLIALSLLAYYLYRLKNRRSRQLPHKEAELAYGTFREEKEEADSGGSDSLAE